MVQTSVVVVHITLQAPFLKGNSNYIMKAEIVSINGKPPQNKLVDGFKDERYDNTGNLYHVPCDLE
jgi:hypothetical protein